MKAFFASAAPNSWLVKRSSWLDHDTVVGLTFALKTFAASLLGLFIAFWAGLDDPRWVFLTVFVVSQPDSGLVLAKSFYRILGTFAGMFVTIALVFAVSQYGELYVAAMAAWICLCNFAARAVRSFASYGFQLAGYTVSIVGLPAALEPSGAYPLVVARFTEILLGILCAALVNRLVLIHELSPKLVALVRSLVARADGYTAFLLESGADPERIAAERIKLTNQYLAIQAMQRSAFFESAEARIIDQPLRQLTDGAVELCALAQAAAIHRIGLAPHAADPAVAQAFGQKVSALVNAADEHDVEIACAKLRQSMAAFDRGQDLPRPTTACVLWSDPVSAALAGVRSALAVGITTTIWFVTAWPNGPTAVVVAAVVSSLAASMEQPVKISMALGATVLVAAIPIFATQFDLMPLAVDFSSLAAALAPITLVCGFIIAQPKIGALGLLAIVYFAFASNISNVETYDAVAFLNSSLAILVGIAVAVLLFALFFPVTPAFAIRRFRRQLVVHLSYLVGARAHMPALHTYQRDLCEQLGAALAHIGDDPEAAGECLATAAVALSAAQAIGRLKNSLDPDTLPPKIACSTSRLLVRLAHVLRNSSTRKFDEFVGYAWALARDAFAALEKPTERRQSTALLGVVVGAVTLGSDLMRAGTGEISNAIRI